MTKDKKIASISTFLGSDAHIEGLVEFRGTIRVDGRVKGKIFSQGGTLIVGEKAVVHADVVVGSAVIMGEVNGTIDAQKRVEIYAPGRVNGDVKSPAISIEPGACFNGNCVMLTNTVSLK
jgi:cytoskeletal protein CcmA (bactofilin family)